MGTLQNLVENSTLGVVNNSLNDSKLQVESHSEIPLWFKIADNLALVILSCGFLANSTTIYILSHGKKLFGSTLRILLRHQAGVDAFASICAIIIIVQKPFWTTGELEFSHFSLSGQ